MELTPAIQEALLALVCHDEATDGGKLAKSLVPADAYDVYFKDLAGEAFKYWEKYGKPPGEHTYDLVETLAARVPDAAENFWAVFESLEKTKSGINRAYVISQATAFARRQRLKQGIATAVEELQTDSDESLLRAEAAMTDALNRTHELFDPGGFLSNVARSLKFLDRDEDGLLTGIKELDEKGLGPARKRFHLFMALYGKGKSWWCLQLLKMAVLARWRVLYVSCELSEDDVFSRIMQMLFSITKRDEPVKVTRFVKDKHGRLDDLDVEELRDRPYLADPRIRTHLVTKIIKMRGAANRVLVKEFPTGELTVAQLKAYLDGLEGACSFIPDLLIIDYPDLMDIDPKNQTTSLGKIYKDLRGIAIRRNIAVAAVTQSNREGETAKTLGGKQISGDFSKAATSDVFITYNQTEAEHEKNLARLFVQKGRTDRDRFSVLVSQAYAMGQFVVDSAPMDNYYWQLVDDDAGE